MSARAPALPGGPCTAFRGWRWAFVAASFDPAAGAVRLWQAAGEQYLVRDLSLCEQSFSGSLAPARGDLLLAARGPGDSLYNGKIDRPRVFSRALTAVELDALREDESPATDALAAAWDFGADIGSDHARDKSPNKLHGRTINLPTLAVTDHTWDGHETRWDRAPDQYAAIHFHDDDVEEAGWQPDLELLVPHGMRSGVYAARLEADSGEEYIPFYVRPPRDTAIAPVAFLAPRLTYMAYANERLYWSEGNAKNARALHR